MNQQHSETERHRLNSLLISIVCCGFHAMAIESDSLALQQAEYGSSTAVVSTPTFFRHPNGDIVHEIQLGTGLKQQQKMIGDAGTAEYIHVLHTKDEESSKNVSKDVPGTDIPNTEQFQLPQSSYWLLISADICSMPFNTGILALGLSLMCLICVLCYTLGNPLMQGLPVTEVIIAKYVAVMMAVLMEDEIPTGIELIGKGAQQVLSGGRRKLSMKRIVFSSMIRLTVGYMFLTNALLLIVQQMAVLPMFLGVLGLLFVERIDDAIFTVSKRGFFGQDLMHATNNLPSVELWKGTKHHKLSLRCVIAVYVLNLSVGYIVLTYATVRQVNAMSSQ